MLRLNGIGMWCAAELCLCVAALATLARGDKPQAGGSMLDILSVLSRLRSGKSVVRAAKLAAPELFTDLEKRLQSFGYPFEEHTVRTEDGYLLTLHRIPWGRRHAGEETNKLNEPEGQTRPPVIFQHGLMSCSEYFVIAGPGISPALRLADSGYDVWLMNSRGNTFSNKHETMKRRDKRFWMFSLHELGAYDIPAVIDYILNATKQEKLYHIGHSMGNTVFFIAMSMRPEYNEKVRLHLSLSPAVFFDNYISGPFQLAVANRNYLKNIFEALPTYELRLESDYIAASNYFLCHEGAYGNKICPVLLSMIVGPIDLNNTTRLTLYFSRSGSGSSLLVLWHFGQIISSGKFIQLDHGEAENLRRYGSPQPPEYPLHKVTAPVAIYAAEMDFVVPVQAAEHLASVLPNVVAKKIIREKFFNHFDFGIHPQLNEFLTNHVLDTMARF